MKHLIKFVILGCMLTVLLSVLSLQKAEAKIPLSGAACSGCEELAGVAAVSAKDIWAVGGHYDSSSGQILSLIENWNGTRWSVATSPNPGSGGSLSGVVAVSSINVWAVGTYYNKSNTERTLIEHWNGTSWSVVKSPNVWLSTNYLSGVTAVSATDVWAVGTYDNSSGQELTLIENWNGTSWSVVPSSNPGSINYLFGVAAVSPTDVWAVGYSFTGSSQIVTLIENWNGTSWSVVKSPN